MNTLPMRAARTASQWIFPSTAHARAVPTSTGVTEIVSVRGRAAITQNDRFMGSPCDPPPIKLFQLSL